MVDDNMEISSEHGHNAGEEDIDIDIDLTTGQADEDYILGDAESNVGLGDDFEPQPSLNIGNDDVMIDEDDTSYHMDDADQVEDSDTQNMEAEAIPMSFIDPDLPNTRVNETDNAQTLDFPADESVQEGEQQWDNSHDTTEKTGLLGALPQDSKDTLDSDRGRQSNETAPEMQNISPTFPREVATPQSPQTHSPNSERPGSIAAGEQPRNPSASSGSKIGENDPAHIALGEASPSDDVQQVESDASILLLAHKIVVVYQSTEYALFSTSESDDPDSFFLSDLSIVGQPLVNFFAAIRDVIHEDLSYEDELTMSVEGLGLEIDEALAKTQDATLGQIVNLHEKLLQNEGAESPTSLFIMLRTRAHFSTRLAHLTAGAAEGRGLSEMLSWYEHSESQGDSSELVDATDGLVPYVEGPGAPSSSEDEALVSEGNATTIDTTVLIPQHEEDHDPISPSHDRQVLNDDAAYSRKEHSEKSARREATALVGESPSKAASSATGEYDEDGDLIDYEDEEDLENAHKSAESHSTGLEADEIKRQNGTFTNFIPPCYKPNTCFCSKCNDLIITEYEAINEELRRRSISRAAEDGLLEQPEQEEHLEDEQGNYDDAADEENGIEYSDESSQHGEGYGDGDAKAEDDGLPADDALARQSLFDQEENDGNFVTGDDSGADRAFEEDSLVSVDQDGRTFELNDGFSNQPAQANECSPEAFEHESEFGDEEIQGQDLTESKDITRTPGNVGYGEIARESNYVASSLGFPEAADSESATIASANTLDPDEIRYEDGPDDETFDDSENTAVAEPTEDMKTGLEEGAEDEIDYEDDDEQDPPENQNSWTDMKELPALNSAVGKRPRVDTDVDDNMGIKSKEAKRLRF